MELNTSNLESVAQGKEEVKKLLKEKETRGKT